MRGQSIFADGEFVGLQGPGLVRSIHEPFQRGRIAVVVHGDGDLGLELLDHFLGIIGSHRVHPCDGQKENIHMADELKLILIEGLAQITGVANAEAVHFEDKSSPSQVAMQGSGVDGDIVD